MDLQGRTPQPGMRPDDVNAPARPQQYANTQSPRPSIDGMTPKPSAAPLPAQPMQPQISNEPVVDNQPLVTQPQTLEPIHHKSSKPVILAIVTLLIAGALAVTAFFAFRPETADKVNKVNTKSTTNTESSTTKQTSTSDAVDSATKDINGQVDSLNDTQDFSDTELSDQTLGI